MSGWVRRAAWPHHQWLALATALALMGCSSPTQTMTGCLALGIEEFEFRDAAHKIYFVEASDEVIAEIRRVKGAAPVWASPVSVRASTRAQAQAGPSGRYAAVARLQQIVFIHEQALCR